MHYRKSALVSFLCLGLMTWTLAAPPQPTASPGLGQPAPVWRFDGEDFYLIDRVDQPGLKTWTFLREGEDADTWSRRLWVHKVACSDLRSYELKYTSGWDQQQRDVVYRSDTKLVHSGWVQKGDLLSYRLMTWEIHGVALVRVELELVSRPPLKDRATMEGLVTRQSVGWRRQLSTFMNQAPALLRL